MKPMLAGKAESIHDVRFPAYCTPKLDGIRCLILNGVAVSRKLKPIPNEHVRRMLVGLPDGFDGELIVPGASYFGETSSAIMSRDGEPAFEYHVFDYAFSPHLGYCQRIESLRREAAFAEITHGEWVKPLLPRRVGSPDELARFEAICLEQGYEGVMIRSEDGPYKFGRSTAREGYLLKLKRFEDSEAVVVGYEELRRNENALERDELGYAKRSKAKAGMVGGGTLGKLHVRREDGVEFAIGSGFDDAFRAKAWAERESLVGRIAKYRHQPHGALEAPRCPVFLGFRHEDDL